VSDPASTHVIASQTLILAALTVGESRIPSDVIPHNAPLVAALRQLGAEIRRAADGAWVVSGMGVGSLLQPQSALDMGADLTAVTLLMGVLATHPLTCMMGGDESLCAIPMGPWIAPLRLTGCEIMASPGERLPLMLRGLYPAIPIHYSLPDGGALAGLAILLAGLNISGETIVEAPGMSPGSDPDERLLAAAGADIISEDMASGGRRIRLRGPAILRPVDWTRFTV